MKPTLRIYVDFLKTDGYRRLLLTTVGSSQDIERQNITLVDGLKVVVWSDDLDDNNQPDNLVADGTIRYDDELKRFVVEIDWSAIEHESHRRQSPHMRELGDRT